MVNEVVPVFVTVTTDCVNVLFSRLLPKLKELALNVAFVEAAGAAGLTVKARGHAMTERARGSLERDDGASRDCSRTRTHANLLQTARHYGQGHRCSRDAAGQGADSHAYIPREAIHG